MRWTACLAPLVLAGLSGCSGLIRGMVDTQPRVTVTELDLADPGAVVKGEPVVFTPDLTQDPAADPDLARFAPVTAPAAIAIAANAIFVTVFMCGSPMPEIHQHESPFRALRL